MGSRSADVWGNAFLAATLIGMGAMMLWAPLSYSLAHPGFSLLVLGYFPFGGVLLGLGLFVAWRAQREYERGRRARDPPVPPPGFSPTEVPSSRP